MAILLGSSSRRCFVLGRVGGTHVSLALSKVLVAFISGITYSQRIVLFDLLIECG